MVFFKKKKIQFNLLEIVLTVDIDELIKWYQSNDAEVPVGEDLRSDCKNALRYTIAILPRDEQLNFYFHKNSNAFTHSPNAIINIEDYLEKETLSQFVNMPLEIEISLGSDEWIISFLDRIILIAPIDEGINLMCDGKTSSKAYLLNPNNNRLHIPTPKNNANPTQKFLKINESICSSWVSYSNQIATLSMQTPNERQFFIGKRSA